MLLSKDTHAELTFMHVQLSLTLSLAHAINLYHYFYFKYYRFCWAFPRCYWFSSWCFQVRILMMNQRSISPRLRLGINVLVPIWIFSPPQRFIWIFWEYVICLDSIVGHKTSAAKGCCKETVQPLSLATCHLDKHQIF